MISPDVIKRLAQKYQTTELNIRREYVQHLFLSYFYDQRHTGAIYFKGGTALRIIYRSPRFSEDLDFSSSITSIKRTEDILLAALKEIEREGVKTEIRESKKTSGGYLGILLFRLRNEQITTQIEMSFRKKAEKGEVHTIAGDFIPPYTIMSLETAQFVGEKIQAVLSRRKPRDFYDLYYILRANLLEPRKRGVLAQAMSVLRQSDIRFAQELKLFLPKSHWAVIRDFREVLEREVKRYL